MQYPVTHEQGGKDTRYTITKEWCGCEEPRFVARYCDEWIGQSMFYQSAVMLAVGHNARRKADLDNVLRAYLETTKEDQGNG